MALDLFDLDVTPQENDDWCQAVRLTAATQAATTQGLRPWTNEQRKRIFGLINVFVGKDRELRLALGNRIFGFSGLTGEPLASFNDLSEAQASALITHCFGDTGTEHYYQRADAARVLTALAAELTPVQPKPADITFLFDL